MFEKLKGVVQPREPAVGKARTGAHTASAPGDRPEGETRAAAALAGQETTADVLTSLDYARPPTTADVQNPAVTDLMLNNELVSEMKVTEDLEKRGFWGTFPLIGQDTITSYIWENAKAPRFAPDPNFSAAEFEQLYREAQKALPKEWVETLNEARSRGHFEWLQQRALARIDAQKQLAQLGWPWHAANILSALLDPPALAIAIATGTPAVYAARAARVSNAGWVGLQAAAGAAGGVGIEAARQAAGAPVELQDYLLAAGMGLAIGGAVGTMIRNPNTAQEASVLAKAGQELTALSRGVRDYWSIKRGRQPPSATQVGTKRAEEAAARAEPVNPPGPAEAPPPTSPTGTASGTSTVPPSVRDAIVADLNAGAQELTNTAAALKRLADDPAFTIEDAQALQKALGVIRTAGAGATKVEVLDAVERHVVWSVYQRDADVMAREAAGEWTKPGQAVAQGEKAAARKAADEALFRNLNLAATPEPQVNPVASTPPAQIRRTIDAIIDANAAELGPEATQAAKQAAKQLLPDPVETPPAAAPATVPEPVKQPDTPAPRFEKLDDPAELMRNPRYVSRYSGADGNEYRIYAETDDLSGPYRITRVGPDKKAVVVNRGVPDMDAAVQHVPHEAGRTPVPPMAAIQEGGGFRLIEFPGKLDPVEADVETYRFRGITFKRVFDEDTGEDRIVFDGYTKTGEKIGYMELERQIDGRWKVSMLDVFPEYQKGSGALGFLKIGEKYSNGPVVPDGILLPDGYREWSGRLKWVQDWYRPAPETPPGKSPTSYYSPRQLLYNRELLAMDIEGSPNMSAAARRRLQAQLKAYDDAIASLPPEATDPTTLRRMFHRADDPLPPVGDYHSPQIRAEVEQILTTVLPRQHVSVRLFDTPSVNAGSGGIAYGFYDHRARLVAVALKTPVNPRELAYHETLHALRSLGLFTREEWKTLAQEARKTGLRKEMDLDNRYAFIRRHLDDLARKGAFSDKQTRQLYELTIEEEEIAFMLGRALGAAPSKGEKSVFAAAADKILAFFRRLAHGLGMAGFRTVDDIFQDIRSGAIAGRADKRVNLGNRYYETFDTGFFDELAPGINGQPATPAAVMAHAAPTPPRTEPFLRDDSLWSSVKDEFVDRPAKPLGLFRIDRAGRSGDTDNAAARLFSSVLMNDTVGRARNSLNPFSADLDARRLSNVYLGEYNRARKAAFDEWAKDLNIGPAEKFTRADEFYEQVGLYVAGRVEGAEFHPAVKQLGDHVRRILDDVRQSWQNPMRFPFSSPDQVQLQGRPISGAENLQENFRYLWRKIDHRKLLGAIDEFGETGVAHMVKGAIRSAQPDIDEKVLEALAKGYVRSAHKRSAGLGDEWSIALGEGNRARLGQLMREDGTLTDEQIDDLLTKLYHSAQSNKPKEGNTANLRRRVLLDEAWVAQDLPTISGGTGTLAFRDLLDNNVNNLMHGYIRRASGRLALGRVRVKVPGPVPEGQIRGPDALIDGLTSNEEIEAVLKRVAEWGADNVENYHPKRDIDYLRFAIDRILAVPQVEQTTNLAQVLRDLRAFNVTRLMGQVGIAQLGETGTAVGTLGWKALSAHIPGFRRIVDQAGVSRLGDDFFHELEQIGIGVERLHGMHWHNLDEVGELPFEVRASSRWDRVSQTLKLGERVTYEASGMNIIQQQQERAVAAAVVQKLANLAGQMKEGRPIGRGWTRRLAQLGIDEPMMARVFDQFKHASVEDGVMFGHRITRLNLHRWDDLEARNALEQSVFRMTAKLIQQGDVGNSAVWMSDPIWQTLMQFRSFPFIAWQNQFLYNLHMRDFAAFNTFVWAVGWNAAVRAAQVQLLAQGRSDKEKFLEKQLSPWELGKAGFQRAGWSSIIPPVIDTGLVFAGQEGMFNARTSGQPADAFLGSPTVSMYNQGVRGIGGLVGAAVDGRSPSQGDVRAAASVLPFQNLMPFAQLLSTMISDLPEKSPPRPRNF